MRNKILAAFTALTALLLICAFTVGCTAKPETTELENTALENTALENTALENTALENTAPETTEPAAPETTEPAVPETTEPAEPASDPFKAILDQYADAMANGYYESIDIMERDAAFGADIAMEWKANPQPASYALADLDGNGVNELIIGVADPAYPILYDIFVNKDGAAEHLFDLDFGYRVNFDLYADGLIEVSWANSAFESGSDFYRVENGGAENVTSALITSTEDAPDTMTYTVDGAEVTSEQYDEALAAYRAPGKLTLEWMPISAD